MRTSKNKVVALGVVYPGVEEYLGDCLDSFNNQTYKHYDIWLFNDGLDKALLREFIYQYPALNIYIEDIEGTYTPAEIREIAIFKIKDKYDYLIFTDTDDYISSNRIEKSLEILKDYDFCYNDMILVDFKGGEISENTYFANKTNPRVVSDYKELLNKNFCGLSNTAINLKKIDLNFLKIPANIVAVDWWLFSLLVMKGYMGCFLKNVYTYYRQYDLNTVGGTGKMGVKQLDRGISIKMEQYRSLLKYYPSKFDYGIKKELEDVLLLKEAIKEVSYFEWYIRYQNSAAKEFMWWENIKLKKR